MDDVTALLVMIWFARPFNILQFIPESPLYGCYYSIKSHEIFYRHMYSPTMDTVRALGIMLYCKEHQI